MAFLLLFLIVSVNFSFFHSFLTGQANSFFRNQGWNVSVEKVALSLDGKIQLLGIEILSGNRDSIIHAGDIKVELKIWPLLSREIIIKDIFIDGVNAHLVTDNTGRLNLLAVFSDQPSDTSEKKEQGSPWEIQVDNIHLQNVKFLYSDSLGGVVVSQSVDRAELSFEKFSLLKKHIDIAAVRIEKASGYTSISPAPKDTSSSGTSPWKFSARQINLEDISYAYEDANSHQKFSVALKSALLGVEILDLSARELVVSVLNLQQPAVNFLMSGKKDTVSVEEVSAGNFLEDLAWAISCKEIKIAEGSFNLETGNLSSDSALTQWFPVNGFNTAISNVAFSSDGLNCDISQLAFALNEKLYLQSGKILIATDSTMSGDVKIDLVAATGNNRLRSVTSGDTVTISAAVSGNTGLLKIDKLDITTFSGARLDVTGTISDVTNIEESHCDLVFNSDPISRAQTMSLISFFDTELELPLFNPVIFTGSMRNTFYNPAFTLNIKSTSGIVDVSGNYNLKSNLSNFEVAFSNVRTAELFGEQYPASISGKVIWNGILGGLDDLRGEGSVNVSNLVYQDLSTHDLNLNFNITDHTCEFNLLADDSTLSWDISGEIGWEKSTYYGQLSGNILLNEGQSELVDGNNALAGLISASFSSSPQNMESNLLISRIEINRDNNSTYLDSISWNLTMTDNLVRSVASADFFRAEFNCGSSFEELTESLNKINYGKIIRTDTQYFLNATNISVFPVFDLNISASYDSIVALFIPDSVFSFSNLKLNAGKAEGEQMVTLAFLSDSLRYLNMAGHGVKLDMNSDEQVLNGMLTIDSLNVNGKGTGLAKFKVDVVPEKISSSILVSDTTGAPVYQLGADAFKEKNRIVFKTSEPDWIINSDRWAISDDEFLIWELPAGDFVAGLNIQHEDMQISVSGRTSDSLRLDLKNVLISKLVSTDVVTLAPDGILNANIVYSDKGNQYVDFRFDISDLEWKGIVLDHLYSNGYFNRDSTGRIESELRAQLNDSSDIKLNIVPGDHLEGNVISASFNHIPVKFIEPFTGEYINELNGFTSGEVIISGENQQTIDGRVNLNSITLNIVPLKAWFTIPDDSIDIKSGKVYFDHFMILDSLNKQLFVDGTLNLENPGQITSDLRVSMNDIRVMNTTVKDNPDFFGSVIVNSSLDITGPVTNPSVKGNVRLQQGTNITYRKLNDRSVEEIQKVITFASLAADTISRAVPLTRIKELSGLPLIQTTIEIDPKSIFNFEISSGYDIHIKISGSGLLNYTMLPNNTMSLTGTYEINDGKADLKFTGWPLKNFTITPGSSVRWDGDVTDPDVNLEATSKVKGSYVNPVDNKNRYVDFIVSMKLLDQVSKLRVVFDVKSPDQYISSVLNTLPEDELMRQAVNLLIFESINLPNIESSSNYLTSQMNSFWESQLNSLTKTSIKNVDLSFGIDSYTQTSAGGAEEEKTSLTYEVERKFFRDRASVKVSGRFNDDTQAGQQSNTMIENFILEYQLDTMERKFLKLYTRKDYEDILDGEVNKSGIGFIYRKSYPDFRSIWTRKKKSPEQRGK